MPRETDKSLAAAMAPARKHMTAPGVEPLPSANALESDTETVGFGVPPTVNDKIGVVPLLILDKDQKAVPNKDCFAKRVTLLKTDGTFHRDKFFVKVGTNGCVFDPWGITDEGTQARFSPQHGRRRWDWSEVSSDAFGFYLKYLGTRNRTWYAHVDRELRTNG